MAIDLSAPYLPAAPPRRHIDLALYVDFDGVLQHEAVMWHHRRGIFMSPTEAPGRSLFEWAHILESILQEFPNVALVLSSTWCLRPGYGKALKRLPEGLRARFVGGTFHRLVHGIDPWVLQSFRSTPRWQQILSDVARRKPDHWLALDDDVEGWPEGWRANLIACDGSTGLSSPLVQAELTRKLQAFAWPRSAHVNH